MKITIKTYPVTIAYSPKRGIPIEEPIIHYALVSGDSPDSGLCGAALVQAVGNWTYDPRMVTCWLCLAQMKGDRR